MKKAIKLIFCLIFIFILMSSLQLYFENTSNKNIENFDNTKIMISLVDETTKFNLTNIESSTVFWNKSYDYMPLDESSEATFVSKDANLSPTNVTNKAPSIYIQYEYEYIPDIVQIHIVGDDSSYYYWDYIVNDEEYLNFLLPSKLKDSSSIHEVQIDCLWSSDSNKIIYGNKRYNFEFKVVP